MIALFGWWLMRFDNIKIYMWGKWLYEWEERNAET